MKHMKHIIIYESYQNKTESPQPGDYVICKEHTNFHTLKKFIKNNIGQFIEYRTRENTNRTYDHITPNYCYIIHYDNIPYNLSQHFEYANNLTNCRIMSLNEITHWSPNKQDLELIILSKKFNI